MRQGTQQCWVLLSAVCMCPLLQMSAVLRSSVAYIAASLTALAPTAAVQLCSLSSGLLDRVAKVTGRGLDVGSIRHTTPAPASAPVYICLLRIPLLHTLQPMHFALSFAFPTKYYSPYAYHSFTRNKGSPQQQLIILLQTDNPMALHCITAVPS